MSEQVTNHLLYWRQRRNLSLQKLSARIETSGNQFASPKTLNRWEKGETAIPEWAIPELSKALKVSEVELLHGPAREPRKHRFNFLPLLPVWISNLSNMSLIWVIQVG